MCVPSDENDRELNIANVIKDKVPDKTGKVILTEEDLHKLEQLEGATDGKTRTIRKNTTRQQALQFNAPIGTDLWKDLDHLNIHENTAEDQSRQFNYAQTMDVYHDQMARIPKPLDYRLIAVLLAAIAALYIVYGK
ncbi:hypothetical protein BU16DRAFT_556120 [Lophium mytilinum]|uniref:Uncharacterized protein n=1 Tax=Lophium mytilinum TaxID=390894 RepID=A0A6A6RD24_9PEZI|nr:hypothetical protein BU16DRAFT_556120 [Lophium mytilinum]